MNDFNRHPATSPSIHPGWCFPASCIDTGADTEHASNSVSLTAGDQMWEASLVRRDGHREFDESGETRMRLDVTELAMDGPHGQIVVPADQAPHLAKLIMDSYHEYLFNSAPSSDVTR